MPRAKKDAEEPESTEAQTESTESGAPTGTGQVTYDTHDPFARTDKDAPQAKPRQAPGPEQVPGGQEQSQK